MVRAFLVRLISHLPPSVIQWAQSRPFLRKHLSPWLRRLVHRGAPVVVTVSDGPNQGMRLEMGQDSPLAYWLSGGWEHRVVELLRPLVHAGDTVVDVGAHTGYFTMMFARWVGESGRVWSFEPAPATAKRLRRHVELNDLRQVEVIECAASDRRGRVKFAVLSGERSPSSRIAADATDGAETVEIESVTLDGVWAARAHPPVALIKVDVEDHEVAVLRGAAGLIQQDRPHLLLEIHSWDSLLGCVQELESLNYDIEPIEHRGLYSDVLEAMAAGRLVDHTFRPGHMIARPHPCPRLPPRPSA